MYMYQCTKAESQLGTSNSLHYPYTSYGSYIAAAYSVVLGLVDDFVLLWHVAFHSESTPKVHYSGMGYDVIYYGKLMYTIHKGQCHQLGLVLHCRQQQYKSHRKYMDCVMTVQGI